MINLFCWACLGHVHDTWSCNYINTLVLLNVAVFGITVHDTLVTTDNEDTNLSTCHVHRVWDICPGLKVILNWQSRNLWSLKGQSSCVWDICPGHRIRCRHSTLKYRCIYYSGHVSGTFVSRNMQDCRRVTSIEFGTFVQDSKGSSIDSLGIYEVWKAYRALLGTLVQDTASDST